MDKETIQNFKLGEQEIEVKTGGFAMLAQGAVMLTAGGTTLLATATVAKEDTDLDYFPLGVEYIEKMYARGTIGGGRFRKREARPSDEAVIKAREVDHSIRSLFPKSWKRPVSVVLTVLSYDDVHNPQALTVLGASLALMQAGVPFAGPCASVMIGIDANGEFVVNPDAGEHEDYQAEFIVSGVDGKLLSLEGWGKEVSEEKMNELVDLADSKIVELNKQQTEFIDKVGQTMDIDASAYPNQPVSTEIIDLVKKHGTEEIKTAMFSGKDDRREELTRIKHELTEKFAEEHRDEHDEPKYKGDDINEAVEYVARKVLRDGVLSEEKRISGRKLDEIRELTASVDELPTVHGSAKFTRGLTQSLSIATLGAKSEKLYIDDMEGEDDKTFMHHYNFPNFSVGEAGRYSYYAGRREIGHGAIGENALKYMIPTIEEFPYTIRVVSEILSSNGSTSMAATCASSMALMAAGVPMKAAVAGIGVGLVTNDDDINDYKLLLDIEGTEDFYGDMDFKVCGTTNGITAIQYENKLQGVPYAIIKEAFTLAKNGRAQVLEVMNETIAASRDELPETAPKVETIKIKEDQIGGLIGPGGKNIQALIEEADAVNTQPDKPDIAIEDDGTVLISSRSQEQIDFIKKKIEAMFFEPEIGEIYEGVVDGITDFGAFVKLSETATGLVHKSKIADEFVKDVSDFLKEGDKVTVKVDGNERGKISLTMKGVEQK